MRILKIQKDASEIISNDKLLSRLSSAENIFIHDFIKCMKNHRSRSFVSQLSTYYRQIVEDMQPEQRDRFVFCKIEDHIPSLNSSENDSIEDVVKGDIIVIQYSYVASYLVGAQITLL